MGKIMIICILANLAHKGIYPKHCHFLINMCYLRRIQFRNAIERNYSRLGAY